MNNNKKGEEFILLEDIVYKGNTVKEIVDILTKNGKKVHSIYSLVIDENYSNDNIPVKIKSASTIRNEAWVKFPWEKKEID